METTHIPINNEIESILLEREVIQLNKELLSQTIEVSEILTVDDATNLMEELMEEDRSNTEKLEYLELSSDSEYCDLLRLSEQISEFQNEIKYLFIYSNFELSKIQACEKTKDLLDKEIFDNTNIINIPDDIDNILLDESEYSLSPFIRLQFITQEQERGYQNREMIIIKRKKIESNMDIIQDRYIKHQNHIDEIKSDMDKIEVLQVNIKKRLNDLRNRTLILIRLRTLTERKDEIMKIRNENADKKIDKTTLEKNRKIIY